MSGRKRRFRDGDWVRVTLEGRYRPRGGFDAGVNNYVRLDTAGQRAYFDPEDAVIQAGVYPPLPTKPGSVIRLADHSMMLDSDGLWGDTHGVKWTPSQISSSAFDVVYDAGRAS